MEKIGVGLAEAELVGPQGEVLIKNIHSHSFLADRVFQFVPCVGLGVGSDADGDSRLDPIVATGNRPGCEGDVAVEGLLREGEVLFVSIAEGFELRDDFSEHAGPLDFREGDSAALGFRVEVFDLAKGGAFEFLQADLGCLLKKTQTQFPPALIGIGGRRADLEEGFVNIANHGSGFHREVEKRSG